jgi:hypothetical protein
VIALRHTEYRQHRPAIDWSQFDGDLTALVK